MGTVSTTLPADGQTIDASDVNTPINAILSEFNGNIDDNNIKSGANISGAKLLAGSLPGSVFDTTLSGGWISGGLPAVSSVTNNGNRSYDITFASTVASLLTPGMRLRATRTVTAPIQCADLEASSSQYFSKASATGFSTGTTWTYKAKIKLESYTLGCIAALSDGTNNLGIYVLATGQLQMNGGTVAVPDLVTSYQSVPLGKWTDVSISMTIGTPTGEVRIDDVVVPSFVTASAATTFTVGTPTMYIGRDSSGNYFDGKIAQVAIFNAVISDATLKTYSGQTMTGSETSLEGFWSLNGVLTDLSANANTLTASGGALATATDSPFGQDSNGVTAGTTDYALVMKVSTTTATVQVPEGCTIPTSGGVSAVAYSTATSPFGFTLDKGRWEVGTYIKITTLQNSPVASTWYNMTSTSGTSGGSYLTVPVGQWDVSYDALCQITGTTNTIALNTLSKASSTEDDKDYTDRFGQAGAITSMLQKTGRSKRQSLSIATPFYLNTSTDQASVSNVNNIGSSATTRILATPAGI